MVVSVLPTCAIDVLPSGLLFIGGRRAESAAGSSMDHVDPSTGNVTRSFSLAGLKDVDSAVQAARVALPGWRAVRPSERRNLLLKLATLFEAHAGKLSILTAIENGTPLAFAPLVCSAVPAEWFRYYAGWVDKLEGTVPPVLSGVGFNYSIRVPYGIIAMITAF